MKCVICRSGDTVSGKTTVTLEREGVILVFREVPADVCANCGEAYVDEAVSVELLETARSSAVSGVRMDVRDYRKKAA
jgi:YgiT-type zinc finger domain-containing protein